MKILVVSYYYTPEITPRAFRASSIYSSLIKQGHNVELIYPKKDIKHIGSKGGKLGSRIKTIIRKITEKILPGGKDLAYLPFFLQQLKEKEADLVISIGLPFSVHLAVSIARKFLNLNVKTVIFDYGDPYSANPAGNFCFYAQIIESWALKYCNIILTPIKEPVELFKKIAPKHCNIHVVCQGYNITDVDIVKFKKNSVPTFCYAGVLYKGIREPLSFLRYISEIKVDYRFIVYTNVSNVENLNIFYTFSEQMGDRLVIRPLISRNECIKKLSQMDFLINFSNNGGVQQPSKLVDYTLSKRPYLTINNNQNDFMEFNDYIRNKYSTFKPMDISNFDQDLVAEKIISIVRKYN